MNINPIKKGVDAGREAAETAQRFPWGTTIVICLLCMLGEYVIMNAQYKDVKAERDLYKEKILRILDKNEPVLRDVKDKVDTLAPKVNAAVNTIDTIIKKTHDAVTK